ncbi:MAG: glycosyltransferase family 4 protein [Verrucomicrobiales bacterium]|nr:glycosyltransferase family 4 protein [Verrucomicrobiales bacterium]
MSVAVRNPDRAAVTRHLCAVGSVTDVSTWSGIPFHFWEESRRTGFATGACEVDLGKLRLARLVWNAGRRLRGLATGGFQYSGWFLDKLEAQIPADRWQDEIITFHQHFPRTRTVVAHGGGLNHYLDAPFAALATGRGLDLKLPDDVVKRALELERENYAGSKRVILMARWAAEVMRAECGVAEETLHVILPGANLNLPEDWDFPVPEGRAGKERPFTLGFVGKDWRRKGLPLLIEVMENLQRRGWKTRVLVIGEAPADLRSVPGVEFAGYLDKRTSNREFLERLSGCDVGCLFSEREALGISTLEFLRAGIPVAGFEHEGTADTIPPDAGFRLMRGSSAVEIADRFEEYLQDEARQADCRERSRRWSPLVTWRRCLEEFAELWSTGRVAAPVRPWMGLDAL